MGSETFGQSTTSNRLDPWFDDGNIVLTTEGKYFRVYRGILSSQSPVFKDMFSCPQPEDPSAPEMDGCPIIQLHDAANDLQIVLKALHDRAYPTAIATNSVSLPVAAAFLRLGKKYEIRRLFDEGRACLEGWRAGWTTLPELPTDDSLYLSRVTKRDKYDFHLTNLAREVGLLSMLPFALYTIALSCPPEIILDGYDCDGAHCTLSPINQRACLIGRDKLVELQSSSFHLLADFKCADRLKCMEGRERILRDVWHPNFQRNPFATWDSKWDLSFCSPCLAHRKNLCERCRKRAWDALPSVFGLGSWEEIERNSFTF
ncbi:hypothetical protein HYDPIDRAFT_103482 [Hydnomerulius pinastri MD-312]|uniref:BTB domain-containing protein n=1 Tax=Hydnomerulius pinastri MD-312 TaxID=994086 RepID=A0A0C9VKE9_9AGAM|nr:hypothetical protein HYDPIDRAFT_103482 [Hydnomerulius pinastri MD-312]